MGTGTETIALGFVALAIAAASLALAAAAFFRASRSRALPPAAPTFAEGSAREPASSLGALGTTLEDALARVRRAQERLGELRDRAEASMRRSIDALGRRLVRVEAEVEESARAPGAAPAREEARRELIDRIRHIEASLEVLRARTEISTADRLVETGEYVDAQQLLEDAVARIREVKLRLSDVIGDDPAFAPVIDSLTEAIHAVKGRALDHERQLESVLSASDALLAWLDARAPWLGARAPAGS
jgi:chromosome segregation ATPase